MKKAKLFIISVAGLMCLTACGSNAPKEQDPNFKFNELGSTCMVPPEVKAYIDAMKEQETRLEEPYKISPLFGPEDFNWDKPDKPDHTEYPDEEKGGVDVCDYLSRELYDNTANPVDIKLSWEKGSQEYNEATLKFSTNSDMSEAREVKVTEGANEASLRNLYRATTYYYQLEMDNGYKSLVYHFDTDDYPRLIFFDKINNVRDVGGYMTSYGVRTKQGLAYRGMEINSKAFGSGHNANVTQDLLDINDEITQIGKEIDLRQDNSSATDQTHECHLVGEPGSQEAKDAYECLTVIAYDEFITKQESRKNLKRIFEIFANADEEHVYFHCHGGADRTGMVGFFLNAILGVSYTDLVIDFELTTLTNNKRCHMHNSTYAHFPKFLHAFTTYANYDPEASLNENCVTFLTDYGVTMETIEKIRSIFLPGYTAK